MTDMGGIPAATSSKSAEQLENGPRFLYLPQPRPLNALKRDRYSPQGMGKRAPAPSVVVMVIINPFPHTASSAHRIFAMSFVRSATRRGCAQRCHLRCPQRPYSSAADQAAAALMDRFVDKAIVKKQLLDGNQLQKLALTLGRPSLGGRLMTEAPPPAGCPVPPGYHLVYFTPSDLEDDLGADGSDRSANPPGKFTRRMWAGGKMSWPVATANSDGVPVLRVGEEVEERTTLLSATPKHSSRSGDMILVEVAKELWSPRGLAVTDKRSWIFRQELDPSQSASSRTSMNPVTRELYTRSSIRDNADQSQSEARIHLDVQGC